MPGISTSRFSRFDEVQIAADLERGHVFTDPFCTVAAVMRTLLLGAATMRPIIERLLPGATIVTRRAVAAEFSGDRKLTRHRGAPRSSRSRRDEVYANRRADQNAMHGGAAVCCDRCRPAPAIARWRVPERRRRLSRRDRPRVGMGLNLDVRSRRRRLRRKYDATSSEGSIRPNSRSQGVPGAPPRTAPSAPQGAAPVRAGTGQCAADHTFDSVKFCNGALKTGFCLARSLAFPWRDAVT